MVRTSLKSLSPILEIATTLFEGRAFIHKVVGIAAEPVHRVGGPGEISREETRREVEAFRTFGGLERRLPIKGV